MIVAWVNVDVWAQTWAISTRSGHDSSEIPARSSITRRAARYEPAVTGCESTETAVPVVPDV
ncbi:MAG: hypothetical protein BWY66_01140 [bacterium ADurb.Bin374]|nr:MAG: hypothetical protein BWY66_01140 [bacterium ADurb.Bin374]